MDETSRRRAPRATRAPVGTRAQRTPTRPRGASGPGLGPAIATLAGVGLFNVGATWDVSWHVAAGRETFWSPPHLVLYSGILVILATAIRALALARRRRIAPTPGAVIGATGAVVALASAPLDDLWHRVYGLDVTIWSAPHLLLIGGVALAAFGAVVSGARAHRHPTVPAPWLPFDAPWSASTAVIVVGCGLLMGALATSLLEYDFDVARYEVAWHPPILAGFAAFGLGLGARLTRRGGGALLAGAAFTLARVVADGIQRGLEMPRPDVPLVLVAAIGFEATFAVARARWPGRAPGVLTATVAGGASAVALLAAQWPYSTAMAGAVWSPAVLARAAGPAIAMAAAAAAAGWVIAHRLGDLEVGGPPVGAMARDRFRWSGLVVVAATVGLGASGLAPAIARAGAPREAWDVPPRAAPPVVGQVELVPAVPVVGQPLRVRLALADATLLQAIGRAPAVPFESPRAGDVVEGAMRAVGAPGEFEATFIPREAGRRWFSVYVPIEFGRVAVTAGFTTYRPDQVARATQGATHPAVLRPEPGPDETRPDWLEPVAVAGVGIVLAGALLVTSRTLRRAS